MQSFRFGSSKTSSTVHVLTTEPEIFDGIKYMVLGIEHFHVDILFVVSFLLFTEKLYTIDKIEKN